MAHQKYASLPLLDKLINKIGIYYQTVWLEKKFNSSHHNKWLENFNDPNEAEKEKLNALYLLSKFMFFGQYEVRELLLSMYRDKFKYNLVKNIRRRNSDTLDLNIINSEFNSELSKTRFIGLGDYSESGSYLSYPFRQVNNLPTKLLKHHSEIFDAGNLVEPHVNRYILLDDFCGSGETAVKYNSLVHDIKNVNPSILIDYYVLFATESGINYVKGRSEYDSIESVFILDSSFKSFSDSSRYFTEGYADIDKDFTRSFSEKYGMPLVKNTSIEGHPLGFDEGQLLIGFSHNTPDNSLPIFWGENNWNYFFKRYAKIK